MKVLSLFDGMSCSQIALQGLGIKVDTYYASEVDKYAIEVTQINFPNTVQVGDVTKLDPKDFADVDLIVAGSPCQGFSFAGKQLNFNDPRSALFFEFVRLLKAIKPKYFLLENVRMKKEYQQVISEQVSACYPEIIFGIEPLLINSSLVSAQSRQRLYWTNIPNIKQPEERGIVLRDILETDADTYLSEEAIAYMKRGSEKWSGGKSRAEHYIKHESKKSNCLTANMHKGVPYGVISVDKPKKVGMHIEKVKVRKHEVDITALQYLLREMKTESKKTNRQIAEETNLPITKVEHWFRTDSSFAIPSDDVWFKLKEILGIKSEVFDKQIMDFEIKDGVYETKQRVYSEDGKSPTLTASNTEQMIETKKEYISKQSVEKYVENVNAEFNDPYNKKAVKGDKSTTLRTNSSNGNMWVNEKAIKENKPKQVGKVKDGGQGNRIYSQDGKSSTLSSQSGGTAGSGNLLIETKPKQVGIAADVNGHDILKRVYSPDGKSPTLSTCQGGNTEPKVVKGGALRARSKDADGKHTEWKQTKPQQMLELRKDNKSNAVSTVGKDTLAVNEDLTWRKLTVRECRRLQTIPEDYQMPVSNTQAYKMLGNGFTCEVIKHIFKNMEL